MPLRAFINGEEVLSFEKTDERWSDLKKDIKLNGWKVLLACCMQEGFLRTSNKGFKHFVHAKSENTCDWKPESPEHLRAKIDIVNACKENGWQAVPEYSEDNWRADVLAVQGKKRIAFEVQWSKQTFEETKIRQARYKDSGVRGCWFFREVPREMRDYNDEPESAIPYKEIPAFLIFKNESAHIAARANYRTIYLRRLVSILLQGRFRPCKYMILRPKQQILITFFKINCWKCKRPQHCWIVNDKLVSMCRQNWDLSVIGETDRSFSKHPEIYKAVKRFLLTESGKHLIIGLLKMQDERAFCKELSHHCYYCDTPFYDQFLANSRLGLQENHIILERKVEIEIGNIKQDWLHWCYSENGQFCE